MSSNRFVWSGLDELKAQLRALPPELGGEAAHLIEARANGAAVTIRSGYPSKRGDLRKGLTVTHTRTPFGARSVVTNSSDEALVFERGSEARHYISEHGVRHLTGKMPPNPLFTQTMQRERRALYDVDLRDLLTRKGLTVTGHA